MYNQNVDKTVIPVDTITEPLTFVATDIEKKLLQMAKGWKLNHWGGHILTVET